MAPPATLSVAGKIAIITGSGKVNGIGAGIAAALAANGASVVINNVSDSTNPRAKEVVDKIVQDGGKAVAIQQDVSTAEGANRLVQETLKAFDAKEIHILVNCAGGGPLTPQWLEATQEEVQKTFAVNIFAAIYMTQAVTPVMPKGGRIVNVGSIASKLGVGPIALYCAAKAALDAWTYAAATDLGRGHGITINNIAPGPVPTDGMPKGPLADAIHNLLVPMTRAEERLGTVGDIADAVLLIVSEKSRWITGQFISASGGITGG